MFLPDTDIQTALAAILKTASFGDLPNFWTVIVQNAHPQAFNDIQTALLRRGFSVAQVQAWDQGPYFERTQTLYWCLVNGAGLHNYDPKYIVMLDRRRELPTVEVTNGGIWQAPAITPPTGPGQAFAGGQERHTHGFSPLPNGGRGLNYPGNMPWCESNPGDGECW